MKKLIQIFCVCFICLLSSATSCDRYCEYTNPYFTLSFIDNSGNIVKPPYIKVYEKNTRKEVTLSPFTNTGGLRIYDMPLPVDRAKLPVTYIFEKNTGTKDSLTIHIDLEERYENITCGVYMIISNPRIVKEQTSFLISNIDLSHAFPHIPNNIKVVIKQ